MNADLLPPDPNSARLDVNLPFESVLVLNVFVLFPIVFKSFSSLAGTRWITFLMICIDFLL